MHDRVCGLRRPPGNHGGLGSGGVGRILARSVLPTDEPAIVEFFHGMRGAVHVTFEEGTQSQWLEKFPERGVRFRAEALYAELDVLRELRPKAKAAMVAEAPSSETVVRGAISTGALARPAGSRGTRLISRPSR